MKTHGSALKKQWLLPVLLACMFGYSTSALAVSVELKGNGVEGLKVDFWTLAQFGVEQIDRSGNAENQDGLEFGSDRIRFGSKMKWGKWFGALAFDAENATGSKPASLPNFIRDAFVAYRFDNAFQLKLGQYKTPLGMSFNGSGAKLPLIKRTLSSRLVLNRGLGLMVSGREVAVSEGHLSYDLGIFNPADRSKATKIDAVQKGQDYAYVARLMYDWGTAFHFEASVGRAEKAGGPDSVEGDVTIRTEDYDVFDVGAVYRQGPLRLRAEYIDGDNVLGERDRDEEAWFFEAGYAFNDIVEGVVRYQGAESDIAGAQTDLDRYEVGVNLFLGQTKKSGRLQLNYASVGGDEDGYNGIAGGGNNRFDAILAQVQFAF